MINWFRSGIRVVLFVAAASTGGCASVTSGKDQSLSFETEPVNASCSVSKSGMELAHFQTPMTISLHRAKEPLMLSCTKTGYHRARAVIDTTSSTGAWGNLVVGGIIGVMIDQSSGAAFRYYDPPRIQMLPATEQPRQNSSPIAQGITLLPDGDTPAAVVSSPPASEPSSAPGSNTGSTVQPASGPDASSPAAPAGGWQGRFRL